MEIEIRLMYKSDPDFQKGMWVAIVDGKIISKHFDRGKLKIPKKYKGFSHKIVDIDFEKAGYYPPSDPAQRLMDKQNKNLRKYADVFKEIERLMDFEWGPEDVQGALKALTFVRNYLLNK